MKIDEDKISRAVRWKICNSNYFSDRDHNVFNNFHNILHNNYYAYAANNSGTITILNPSGSEMNGALFSDS